MKTLTIWKPSVSCDCSTVHGSLSNEELVPAVAMLEQHNDEARHKHTIWYACAACTERAKTDGQRNGFEVIDNR